MYDPTIGRFISEDPIRFWGGDYNLARYATNAVTVFVDPNGLDDVTAVSITTVEGDANAWREAYTTHYPDGVQIVEGMTIYARMQSVDDLLTTLESHVRRTKAPIDQLNLSGHGCGPGINFGGTYLHIDYLSPAQIRRLQRVLAPDATVQLWGCGTGNDAAGTQRLANALNVRVMGSTRSLTRGPDSGWGATFSDLRARWNGEPEKWRTFKPSPMIGAPSGPLPVKNK
jgi:Domain of unknown function (DUF4347)